MHRKILITGIFISLIAVFSFFTEKAITPAEAAKLLYQQQGKRFEDEIVRLQQQVEAGNEKNIQQQFLKTRAAYKQAELFIEYYFAFFAVKLNGPSIPFYEEDEPDIGQQQPAGMQVIEGMIFPHVQADKTGVLKTVVEDLLRDTRTMLETMESNAFNDELIFDAVTEEMFRITALGITGFDSQTSGNGLPECEQALDAVQKVLQLYEQEIKQTLDDKKYQQLISLLNAAKEYLGRNRNFNAFDRMRFITTWLDPATKLVGSFKQEKGFSANKSPMFYSTIKKNNSLFAPGIFDPDKYLDDNTTSPAKITLGKMLFFDKSLSKDNNRSCATCHDPAKAFTDGFPTSVAIDGHTALPRNSPTLLNAALQRNLFLDNRSFSLESQVMEVLNNANEMHGSAQKAAENILSQKKYYGLFAQAYPGADESMAARNVCNAIACYERTLIALDSKFDQHMRGRPSMNQNEINGFNLFMGKAKCGTCHFMPLFSGAKPPRYYYNETEVIGVPDKNVKQNARIDEDEGRYLVTKLPMHKYAFKTTGLRNIVLTAPYMHNGVFKTLEEVLEFYNSGGGNGLKIAPENQTLPFDKLNLTKSEQQDIIRFLKTLTDTAPATGK